MAGLQGRKLTHLAFKAVVNPKCHGKTKLEEYRYAAKGLT
jgi:hypothetical protein